MAWLSFAAPLHAQTPKPPSPEEFASTAAQSDVYEMSAARIALVETKDAGIRAFARQMIDEHAKMDAELRQASTEAGLKPLPATMSGDQARMLSALQSARGPEFDRAYVQQQVLAHTAALTVQQGYASDGGNTALKRAASSAAPTVQHHLVQAKDLGRASR